MKFNKNRVVYPAIFSPEHDESTINVSFPDVPEALTFGKNVSQAIFNAQEALGLALYDYKNLPKVSKKNDIHLYKGQKVVLIPIDLEYEFSKVKPVRVSKNTSLLASDAFKAQEIHANCSKLLTYAIRSKYKKVRKTDQ